MSRNEMLDDGMNSSDDVECLAVYETVLNSNRIDCLQWVTLPLHSSGILFVSFTDGSLYSYGDWFQPITKEVYDALSEAGSVGSALDALVKGRYPYRRLRGRREGNAKNN